MSYEGKLYTYFFIFLLVVGVGYLIFGWKGVSRGCSGCVARAAGTDWIIVQLDLEGEPFRCWELRDVSVANESQSDGIYWEEENGNLVHISGLYNRVQVSGGNWDAGFRSLGLTRDECAAVRRGERPVDDIQVVEQVFEEEPVSVDRPDGGDGGER